MKIAIHQPNFLPYAPYFEKIKAVDLFVFLEHCQWDKGGHQNRFNLDGAWYTMSVHQGLELVIEKYYAKPASDWASIKGRLPCYKEVLKEFDGMINESLCLTNVDIIQQIMRWLGIKTPIELDYPTDLLGNNRLIDICKHYHATTYVSNPGGQRYLDAALFGQNGIQLEFMPVPESPKHILPALTTQHHP